MHHRSPVEKKLLERPYAQGRLADGDPRTITVTSSSVDFASPLGLPAEEKTIRPSVARTRSTYVPGVRKVAVVPAVPSVTSAKPGSNVTPAGPRQTRYETANPSGDRGRTCRPRGFTPNSGRFLGAATDPGGA